MFVFDHNGWHNIIGFHTRNVPHVGHEYIQINALRKINADAIFISPVIGEKKIGDFLADPILKCYELLIKEGVYNPYGAIIGSFNTHSRYSGPREAVFTALCRQNFGCNYFIVGRDHTGVGNYYDPNASIKLFDKLELNIKIREQLNLIFVYLIFHYHFLSQDKSLPNSLLNYSLLFCILFLCLDCYYKLLMLY